MIWLLIAVIVCVTLVTVTIIVGAIVVMRAEAKAGVR